MATETAFWRSVERGPAPYAERADRWESAFDRRLLAASAWLRRPLPTALKEERELVREVERLQPAIDALGREALRGEAEALRPALLRQGFALPLVARSFALVRAAAWHELGLRHFPVQMMGGHAMLMGLLAEMDTGEGKTLTASLPAATAALAGQPVHVITVNDYLAARDAAMLRPVYEALGLSVGVAQEDQEPDERRAAWLADITYCTNKDLGFDYLRDGLVLAGNRGRGRLLVQQMFGLGDRAERLLLRGLAFAIIDEADSVLVDEARTPLVISAGGDDVAQAELHATALAIAQALDAAEDFRIERQDRAAHLTPQGRKRLQELAHRLPPAWRSELAREELVQQALAALHLFVLDVHYLVRDGKVMIIDEYTGRVMPDRSWERGLQQLVEAKEGCTVSARRGTLARITYQRLFRRYLRVSGMSGTAREVGPELEAVYGLKVTRIPTHRVTQRRDLGTRLYADRTRKWQAVAGAVQEQRAAGRPVLVGTRSVAASEELAEVLSALGIEHMVLNARQDSAEAAIVAEAGGTGRVTIATNMAGRGTDIRLAQEVVARGGLHVILTEFHESARIDRQLFGRCARQGDPGSHEAIVSVDDAIFARHSPGLARILAARYATREQALPGWAARILQARAQQAAEAANGADRRSTLEQDRRLDRALAFAGGTE
ncbi:preprotein translocase subunit SecA [Ramlibacter sp. G-1-2-2]|uniref:Protein translocase subunit SecA n=1 Tax=Ramlibacter agri TaxID=2728837 RepID=A0A848HJY1_9BURK|nr:preprotein translocase subunit SecA [Ramlibacter agri]NML48048.1 preprotein translocase subunit SecA [Ramlibacter agri]